MAPYDDPYTIAGQGTIGLEILQQCAALKKTPDFVFVPIGGGGLIAGRCPRGLVLIYRLLRLVRMAEASLFLWVGATMVVAASLCLWPRRSCGPWA